MSSNEWRRSGAAHLKADVLLPTTSSRSDASGVIGTPESRPSAVGAEKRTGKDRPTTDIARPQSADYRRLMAYRLVGRVALALVAAMPISVSADSYNSGPFYVRFDEGSSAEDRRSIAELIGQSYGRLDFPVALCATTPLRALIRSREQSVRLELIQAGIVDTRIRTGGRCDKRLRQPPIKDAAKDAVVVIVGPSGS